ncbi:MAG: efflux RND transporter periplasmic adaptor subunit [Pseudomonadota bacterium]
MILPLLIVFAGFGLAALLIATGPSLEPQPAESLAPLVRVVQVSPRAERLLARTHGTVVPRTESELIPEVDGRVIEVSPKLVSGGFFDAGETLLRIEPVDYEVALETARAGLARASSDLSNARKTLARQLNLQNRGATSEAQRDDAANRVRIAEAAKREATARLARATRDLERTRITAPYDGRVRSERVDVGQFVRRGTAVGTVYAVDYAEVRLPIQDEELAFLDLPLTETDPAAAGERRAEVVLRARFAGAEHEWLGEVVRTEGEIDPSTRMVQVVARVAAPYVTAGERPPLAVGLFVDAQISGALVPDLVRLPRSALRDASRVFVVDADSRLWFRDVSVLRRERDEVLIAAGLRAGEWVCVSSVPGASDGMRVRFERPETLARAASGDPEATGP